MEFEYKVVSSMSKIFPIMENIEELKEEKLTGLQGETVSFQIAYHWEGERKERGNISVKSPIQNMVHVRDVNLVPCEYPCHMQTDEGYLTKEPGLYPDLLTEIPKWGFPLISGQWRSLWVDIKIDENQKSGIYPIDIQLEKEGSVLGEVKVYCEVLGTKLPKLTIPHTEWFHSDCLANYYDVEVFSEEYWRIVENFIETAVEHKCNMLLTPVFTPPLDTAVGGERRTVQLVDVSVVGEGIYEFKFDKLRRWIEMAERCGIQYFEISHLFSQWGAKYAPKVIALKDGSYQQIFGWDTEASGEEYTNFLHQFLILLKEELKKGGVLDRCYFHLSDEPQMEDLESYRKAWESIKDDLKGCQVIDALSDYEFYKNGLVHQPVCATNHIRPFIENKVEKLWCYYCTAQWDKVSNRFIVMPGNRTRIIGMQIYRYDLDGFLHWGYNFYNSEYSLYPIDPYRCTDAGGAFPSGDPFLVYPGENGKPEESIRLMLMDEAMSDYCACKALESLIGKEKVVKLLDEEMHITFDEYPQTEMELSQLRDKINHAIKEQLWKEN